MDNFTKMILFVLTFWGLVVVGSIGLMFYDMQNKQEDSFNRTIKQLLIQERCYGDVKTCIG